MNGLLDRDGGVCDGGLHGLCLTDQCVVRKSLEEVMGECAPFSMTGWMVSCKWWWTFSLTVMGSCVFECMVAPSSVVFWNFELSASSFAFVLSASSRSTLRCSVGAVLWSC